MFITFQNHKTTRAHVFQWKCQLFCMKVNSLNQYHNELTLNRENNKQDDFMGIWPLPGLGPKTKYNICSIKCYIHLGKEVWPTYPPAIALLTFASNIFGLSLNTAAASWFKGSSWLGSWHKRKFVQYVMWDIHHQYLRYFVKSLQVQTLVSKYFERL